jgi:hypothetical protein
MWSLLSNFVLAILIAAAIEHLGLPLLEVVAVEHIEPASRHGRLLTAILAAFLFVSGVRGCVVLLLSLITSFYLGELLPWVDPLALFLLSFIAFFTAAEHLWRLLCENPSTRSSPNNNRARRRNLYDS